MENRLREGWQEIGQLRFNSAITIASELLHNPILDIRQQAHRLMGMAYYRKELYAEAIPYFESSIQMIDNFKDRFSLSMCYGLLGNISQSEQTFQDIDSPWGLPVEYYGLFAILRADQGNFEGAIILLEKIKLSYTLFGISDETFLYIRGQPPFNYALDFVYQILTKVSQQFDFYQWLDSFAEEMDEEGKISLGKVRDQINLNKNAFSIQQLPSRLEYPLVCRIEEKFFTEKEIVLSGRMMYGKLYVGDLVSLYSVDSSVVIGKTTVSSIKKAQSFYDCAQAKELVGIILNNLEKELKLEERFFLVASDCQSSEYFQQFPLIS